MKKILFSLIVLSLSVSAQSSGTDNGLSDARVLAEQDIIVNQSTMSPMSGTSFTADIQEASMYRLGDTILRQEALGIALKVAKFSLPGEYKCRNYFTDAREWWVCRVAEVSADNKIVSRENLRFRPQDVVTLAESLGILVMSTNIPRSNTSNATVGANIPDWQKNIILTLNESGLGSFEFINGEYRYFVDDTVSFSLSHRMTRGDFFRVTTLFLNTQDPTAHCSVYNDGCNDCTRTDGESACTERACFWQGIPSCSECEAGYTLENNRCVKKQTSCIAEGDYAGGGFVMNPENMDDFQCCAGLTRAERKDGSTLADAGYTCIREGDNSCDARYESSYNSADCRGSISFDNSVCQGYYDGCNNCSRGENGQTACTLMACPVNGPAYCTSYVPYVPKNQTEDSAFLAKVVSEMRNYAKDLSCTINAQCQWSMVGHKACGGPSAAIAFSSKNVDTNLVTSKGTYITNAEKKFNETYGIMSDCMLIQPPAELRCINGTCQ